jgi:hypothetical protein
VFDFNNNNNNNNRIIVVQMKMKRETRLSVLYSIQSNPFQFKVVVLKVPAVIHQSSHAIPEYPAYNTSDVTVMDGALSF